MQKAQPLLSKQKISALRTISVTQGYVMVVVLLVMFMGILMIGLSTVLLMTSGKQQTMTEFQKRLRYIADSAVEDTILLLLRRPNHQGLSTVMIEDVPVRVHVTRAGNQITIDAVATDGGQMQQSKVVVERINGMLEVVSWKRNQ